MFYNYIQLQKWDGSATKMGWFSYKNGTIQLQKWDGSATKMGRFSYKNGTVQLQKWDGSATFFKVRS